MEKLLEITAVRYDTLTSIGHPHSPYFQHHTAVSDNKESDAYISTVSAPSLFDQVVQRYQEELDKLKDDPAFKPIYIGIKDMGEEIRVWALIEDTDRYTRQQLRNIQYGANMDIAFDNQAIVLTYYFYPKYHGCNVPNEYQKLFPNF